jgi:preprotein translocase subunit SecF
MLMLTVPNIYKYKNLKLLIAIPVVLMLFGIYLSRGIVLDTSLSGGVSVTIQTNATVDSSALAAKISSALSVPTPVISQSPGGLQITISNNQSLANAEDYLIGFYDYKANYTNYTFNATNLRGALSLEPNNQTLERQLNATYAGINSSMTGMNQQLQLELLALQPFAAITKYNSSNVDQMSTVAQNAYQNASLIYKQKVLGALHSIVPFTIFTYQQITPTLSKFFLGQVEQVIIIAFVLILITVLIVFRSIVPSIAVVFGAGNDMLLAIGAMALLHIPFGLASLAGLLMIIGYAIDTEMLTAIRILKRSGGTAEERAYHSMKTGLTMTGAAIASFAVLFIVSFIAYVPTYYEISGVVLFGLIGDILTTWFGNAPMMLIFKKRHERV